MSPWPARRASSSTNVQALLQHIGTSGDPIFWVACGALTVDMAESDGQARLLSTLLLTGDELSVTDRAERAALAYPDRESHADRLRRARNQDRYEAKPVGAAATKKAEHVAWTLFDAALGRAISP